MTRDQLEHAIRAVADLTGETKLIIIGSQAILGQFPDLPPELRRTQRDTPRDHPKLFAARPVAASSPCSIRASIRSAIRWAGSRSGSKRGHGTRTAFGVRAPFRDGARHVPGPGTGPGERAKLPEHLLATRRPASSLMRAIPDSVRAPIRR